MPEQDQVIDPTVEATPEEEARMAEVTDAAEPNGASAPVSAVLQPSNGSASPSILDRLREAYAAGESERTTIIPIAPGRYQDLAAKYRPFDWDLKRKLQRRAEKTNDYGPEANANFQARLVADACLSIMIRPAPGEDWVEAHTLNPIGKLSGGQVIRYDRHLAEVLGMELIGGETQADVCRLVFGEEGAFEVHHGQLAMWSTQVVGDEEDDEDAEGSDRPT